MPVVTVSLTEGNLEAIERMQKAFGLKGRSEAIRASLRAAEDEIREREELTGEVDGVLIAVHESHTAPDLDSIRHRYSELISTQIHSHMRGERCLEVFIVKGDAGLIRKMITELKGQDTLEYVKFVPS